MDRLWDRRAETYVNEIASTFSQAKWASPSKGSQRTMARFQSSLAVCLISTPCEVLHTCADDTSVSDALTANVERYDHVPVVNSAGGIVGVLFRGDCQTPVLLRRVGDIMRPLNSTTILQSDSCLIDFVRNADRFPTRLLKDRDAFIGLVTLADLQKLPVRVVLFAAITQLEMNMAAAIEFAFPATVDWRRLLDRKQDDELENRIGSARHEDHGIKELDHTDFRDKETILSRASMLAEHRETFKIQIKKIRRLRNKVAHGNDYAATRGDANELPQLIRWIDDWTAFLERACA